MLIPALGALLLAWPVADSVKADLNSPVYAVRENARDTLRSSFVPTDRAKWDALVVRLQELTGASRQHLRSMVLPENFIFPDPNTNDPRVSRIVFSGSMAIFRYRLDNSWVLTSRFDDDALVESYLVLAPQLVDSEPPPNYTGLWRFYCANGTLAESCYYVNGKRSGPLGDGRDTHVREERREDVITSPSAP